MSTRNWILLFLLSILWGGSFFFARIAVLEVPPLTLVLVRVGLAAITLHFYMMVTGKLSGTAKGWWPSFIMLGLLNNAIPFSLLFIGQKEIGAGLASIVNAMTPIWSLLIAHWFTSDEQLSTNKVVGVVLGFIGVATLIGIDAMGGLSASVWAQIAVLGATISYGFSSVYAKRFKALPPMETARGQLFGSTLLMTPVVLLVEQPWQITMPSTAALIAMLGLAVLCTALAYLLFFRIVAEAGAVNSALVTLLVPLSAILLGVLFLDEVLALRHMVGMGLIIVGLIAIDGRILNAFKQRYGTNRQN